MVLIHCNYILMRVVCEIESSSAPIIYVVACGMN